MPTTGTAVSLNRPDRKRSFCGGEGRARAAGSRHPAALALSPSAPVLTDLIQEGGVMIASSMFDGH